MDNKLITTVITMTIVVILAGAVIAPVIEDAKLVVGEPVVYENDGVGYNLAELDGATMSVTMTGTAGEQTITVNGMTCEGITGYNIPAIVTDSVFIQIASAGAPEIAVMFRSASGSTFVSSETAGTFTATFEDGTATIDNNGTETTYTYTWLYAIDEDGEYINTSNAYMNNYLPAGGYPTLYGYNSTIGYYTYHEGVVECSNVDDPTIVTETSLVDGTTDVYISPSGYTTIEGVNAGDAIVLAEVNGHADDGNVALVGSIMVMVIISLVVMSVGLVYRKRD